MEADLYKPSISGVTNNTLDLKFSMWFSLIMTDVDKKYLKSKVMTEIPENTVIEKMHTEP